MSLRKILFIGKPAAGKGTQANRLEKYGLKPISTGKIIRQAIRRQDPLIIPYHDSLDRGFLLPDKEIFELINRELQNIGQFNGYILDGAIRTLPQAEIAMEKDWIEESLFFDLSDKEAIRRMGKRYTIEKRGEDAPENRLNRLRVYREETEPVIDYLRGKIPVYNINASPDVETVLYGVLRALNLK